jgi:hypothetical protein
MQATETEDANLPASSRALVLLAPAAKASAPVADHRQAAFLAHLIATKDRLPQTRKRRRSEPGVALAAYGAVAALAR